MSDAFDVDRLADGRTRIMVTLGDKQWIVHVCGEARGEGGVSVPARPVTDPPRGSLGAEAEGERRESA